MPLQIDREVADALILFGKRDTWRLVDLPPSLDEALFREFDQFEWIEVHLWHRRERVMVPFMDPSTNPADYVVERSRLTGWFSPSRKKGIAAGIGEDQWPAVLNRNLYGEGCSPEFRLTNAGRTALGQIVRERNRMAAQEPNLPSAGQIEGAHVERQAFGPSQTQLHLGLHDAVRTAIQAARHSVKSALAVPLEDVSTHHSTPLTQLYMDVAASAIRRRAQQVGSIVLPAQARLVATQKRVDRESDNLLRAAYCRVVSRFGELTQHLYQLTVGNNVIQALTAFEIASDEVLALLSADCAAIENVATGHNAPERDTKATDGEVVAQTANTVPLPTMGPHDRQAYQLSIFHGMSQSAIAAQLNQEHGTTYSQGRISKMIKRAKRHAEASGLSNLIPPPAQPVKAIDPQKLEIGKRTDHRTRSQRSKSD